MATDMDGMVDMAADMDALETCLDEDALDEENNHSRREHASPVQSHSTLRSCGRFRNARVDMTATRRVTAPHSRTGNPPATDNHATGGGALDRYSNDDSYDSVTPTYGSARHPDAGASVR